MATATSVIYTYLHTLALHASLPISALLLGISSGFPFAMIGATLTTRLAQDGIEKSSVTAFALTFLAYNLKWAWAPAIDRFRIPLLGRVGQRRSWLIFVGALVFLAVSVQIGRAHV